MSDVVVIEESIENFIIKVETTPPNVIVEVSAVASVNIGAKYPLYFNESTRKVEYPSASTVTEIDDDYTTIDDDGYIRAIAACVITLQPTLVARELAIKNASQFEITVNADSGDVNGMDGNMSVTLRPKDSISLKGVTLGWDVK